MAARIVHRGLAEPATATHTSIAPSWTSYQVSPASRSSMPTAPAGPAAASAVRLEPDEEQPPRARPQFVRDQRSVSEASAASWIGSTDWRLLSVMMGRKVGRCRRMTEARMRCVHECTRAQFESARAVT